LYARHVAFNLLHHWRLEVAATDTKLAQASLVSVAAGRLRTGSCGFNRQARWLAPRTKKLEALVSVKDGFEFSFGL
jgi:hypothetical protein